MLLLCGFWITLPLLYILSVFFFLDDSMLLTTVNSHYKLLRSYYFNYGIFNDMCNVWISCIGFQLQYDEYKQTLETLQTKIIQLGHDKDEHDIVLKTLETTDSKRKCYRMIGGALVESDVETTRPILETKRKNLEDTINKMKEELVRVASEFEKWKKDNKIQVVKQ